MKLHCIRAFEWNDVGIPVYRTTKALDSELSIYGLTMRSEELSSWVDRLWNRSLLESEDDATKECNTDVLYSRYQVSDEKTFRILCSYSNAYGCPLTVVTNLKLSWRDLRRVVDVWTTRYLIAHLQELIREWEKADVWFYFIGGTTKVGETVFVTTLQEYVERIIQEGRTVRDFSVVGRED